ncbi:MAG: hypothetical protein V1810_02260 [Candidatus Beckwithbacteria bacterium]
MAERINQSLPFEALAFPEQSAIRTFDALFSYIKRLGLRSEQTRAGKWIYSDIRGGVLYPELLGNGWGFVKVTAGEVDPKDMGKAVFLRAGGLWHSERYSRAVLGFKGEAGLTNTVETRFWCLYQGIEIPDILRLERFGSRQERFSEIRGLASNGIADSDMQKRVEFEARELSVPAYIRYSELMERIKCFRDEGLSSPPVV